MAYKFRFRNIYGQSMTKWEDINPMGGTTDGLIAAGNSKFIAFPVQSGMGSCLGILGYDQAGRVKSIPQFQAHSSHITDFKFMPYHTNRIATCSQDSTIKLWEIQEESIADTKTPLAILQGHNLKVNLIAPHHSAKSILASSSYDKTIKVWDWEEEKNVLTYDQETHYALCLEWSYDGQLLGTTWNDSNVRLIDPRQNNVIREFQAHVGSRAQKFSWLGNTNHFITTGVDKLQKREIGLWDVRNTSTHIKVVGCSQGQGVLHTYFDSDLGILYTNGKGEGTIRFFEYTNGSLTCHQNDYTVTDATKGYGFVEKQYVNPSISEIGRVIKLTNKYAEAVSIVYPRKSLDFQPDLFPDCSVDFGQNSSQWLEGSNVQPLKASMNTHAQPVAAVSSVRKASQALSSTSSTKARSPKVSKLSEDTNYATSQTHQATVTQQPIQLATPSQSQYASAPQVSSQQDLSLQTQQQPKQQKPQPVLTSSPTPTLLPQTTNPTQVQAPTQPAPQTVTLSTPVQALVQQGNIEKPIFHKEEWQNCHSQLQQIQQLSNGLKENFQKIQYDINDEEKDKQIEELTSKLHDVEGQLEQKNQEVLAARNELEQAEKQIQDLESSKQAASSPSENSPSQEQSQQAQVPTENVQPNVDTQTLENIREALRQHKSLVESLEAAIAAQQQGDQQAEQQLLESSQAIVQGFQLLSGFVQTN